MCVPEVCGVFVWNRIPSVDLSGRRVLESKETMREELEMKSSRKRELREWRLAWLVMKPLLLEGA
jgi:hypothetical protein